MKLRVAIRVDVCIRRAAGEPLIRLMRRLEGVGAPVTLCVATGKDRSGRAVGRLLRDPVFASRAWRMGALRTYGLRTAVSGTLLPARPIVPSDMWEQIGQWSAAGHEVALHGHDHRAWQDGVAGWTADQVADSLGASGAVFQRHGIAIAGTAAPAWTTSPTALREQDRLGLPWASDLRGSGPCRIRLAPDDQPLITPQIPVNLPMLDELVVGQEIRKLSSLLLGAADATLGESPGIPLVYAAHPEVDGGGAFGAFSEFIDGLVHRGARFSTIGDCLEGGDLPERILANAVCPGRSFEVATDGTAFERWSAMS